MIKKEWDRRRRFWKKFYILVSEPQKFIEKTRVLPVKVRNLTVDIIFATLPYEEKAIDRAIIDT